MKLFLLLKIKEGLKTATEIALLFLMASFFSKTRLLYCDFSLRYKIAFSAIPEFDNSLIAENSGRFLRQPLVGDVTCLVLEERQFV